MIVVKWLCLRMMETLVVLMQLLLVVVEVYVGGQLLHDRLAVGMRGCMWNVMLLLKLVLKSRITVLLMNLTRGLINGLIVQRIHY